MRSRTRPLFNDESFSDVKRQKIDSMKRKVQNEDADRITGVEKDEYIDYIISKYAINPVKVATEKAQIDAETFSRDEDPTLLIPVDGNTDILDYKPKAYSIGYAVRGKVKGNELQVELRGSGRRGWTEESLNKEIERATDHIDTYLDRLEAQIENYHEELRNKAERAFKRRREEVREQREMLGSLDVPLRKSDNTPDTFAIEAPEQRETVSLTPPQPSGASASDPAPTVPESTYRNILEVINDVGIGFERSPRLFRDLEEEDLRDHILFALERNFEAGTATGETFNKDGKSDILLRADDGTNVFIAECAIWGGEKYFVRKINQLNRYLTWRDTKAAVIMFVCNQQMGPVRKQIDEGVANHPQFVENVDQPGESWWQYRFHFEDDPDRELNLAVLAFHIPPE